MSINTDSKLRDSYGPEPVLDSVKEKDRNNLEVVEPKGTTFGNNSTSLTQTSQLSETAIENNQASSILGLRKPVFFTLSGLEVVIVLGVAIGTGLGFGLHNSHLTPVASSISTFSVNSSTTASNPTTSITSPLSISSGASISIPTQPVIPSSATAMPANPCSESDIGKTGYYNSTKDDNPTNFTTKCYVDWPIGSTWTDNGAQGPVLGLMVVRSETFDDCMDECIVYNFPDGQTQCAAVVYNWNTTGLNCYLKDALADHDNISNNTAVGYLCLGCPG